MEEMPCLHQVPSRLPAGSRGAVKRDALLDGDAGTHLLTRPGKEKSHPSSCPCKVRGTPVHPTIPPGVKQCWGRAELHTDSLVGFPLVYSASSLPPTGIGRGARLEWGAQTHLWSKPSRLCKTRPTRHPTPPPNTHTYSFRSPSPDAPSRSQMLLPEHPTGTLRGAPIGCTSPDGVHAAWKLAEDQRALTPASCQGYGCLY